MQGFRDRVRTGESGLANSTLTDLRQAVSKLPAGKPTFKGIVMDLQTRHLRGEPASSAGGVVPTIAALIGAVAIWLWHRLRAVLTWVGRAIGAVWRFLRYALLWFTVVPAPWLLGFVLALALWPSR